jgi:F0F1-type ATP synthase assembly protein I
MNKMLSLLFLVLSFLSAVAPMVASLAFFAMGNESAALNWLVGSIAGVVPCWLFMELSFRFDRRHLVFPRHVTEK